MMTEEIDGVEMTDTLEEEVKILQTVNTKLTTTVADLRNKLRRIEDMSLDITISHTQVATTPRISTTILTISSSNIMKLYVVQIPRHITSGTQNIWQ